MFYPIENSGWGVAVVYVLGEKCPLLGEKT
jgi:hypothetical protein